MIKTRDWLRATELQFDPKKHPVSAAVREHLLLSNSQLVEIAKAADGYLRLIELTEDGVTLRTSAGFVHSANGNSLNCMRAIGFVNDIDAINRCGVHGIIILPGKPSLDPNGRIIGRNEFEASVTGTKIVANNLHVLRLAVRRMRLASAVAINAACTNPGVHLELNSKAIFAKYSSQTDEDTAAAMAMLQRNGFRVPSWDPPWGSSWGSNTIAMPLEDQEEDT